MNQKEIISIQEKIGTKPDGFWGEKSITACKKYLRSFMPSSNPWPKSDQKSLTLFYGDAGDESNLLNLNVIGLNIKYDGSPIKTIRCHKKVADSLKRVLTSLSKSNPDILAQYAGVYNNRTMRGGSLPSLHARGAAIDLAPDTNRNKQSWPVSATMPIEVMVEFSKEGWLPAGAFWGRDAMHFQATQ